MITNEGEVVDHRRFAFHDCVAGNVKQKADMNMKLKRTKSHPFGFSKLTYKRILFVVIVLVVVKWYRSTVGKRKEYEESMLSYVAKKFKLNTSNSSNLELKQNESTIATIKAETMRPAEELNFSEISVESSRVEHTSSMEQLTKNNLTSIIPSRFALDIEAGEDYTYDRVYDVPDAATFPMAFIFRPKEDFCLQELNLLITIKSTVNHFAQREVIRRTWGGNQRRDDLKLRAVFLVGIAKNNAEMMMKVQEESELFGDVVVGSYVDSYKNLTLKTLSGFRWMAEYCSKAKFFMTIDDDVSVDVAHLIESYKTRGGVVGDEVGDVNSIH